MIDDTTIQDPDETYDDDVYDAELFDDDEPRACRCPFKANKEMIVPALITGAITVASIAVGVWLQYAITKIAVKDAFRETHLRRR
ncbi:hypothetical protein [Bifidobacterium vansinderenii]|uniref:Uncharacterized protein n=1 Tax=Bifidobacterium vansinderenii TaxID=1984871 RepID=A0A229W014_9BIFI|nr:hypothetical protein [Bifidobacterium vansinderenii]OXN01219.1 hypothetical protein Tam10B_0219 [Bifidobacterium vansinderenii]